MEPISKLAPIANSAKHITCIKNILSSANGAAMTITTITTKAISCARENPNMVYAFPNRPAGRASRTIAITTNTTTAEPGG